MVKLTDGNKTIELTKDEMEIIEEGLQDRLNVAEMCGYQLNIKEIEAIRSKLEGLNYE